MSWRELVPQLACPIDHAALVERGDAAVCSAGHEYRPGPHGYLEVAPATSPVLEILSTEASAAARQESGGLRTYEAYIRPWLQRRGARSVLDVGCGVGTIVGCLLDDGYEAVGVDMRAVASLWAGTGLDPAAFVVGDAVALPFPDGEFDAVLALGVAEHVGTTTGHVSLAPDWKAQRRTFATELARVTRADGRVMIACPNKWFPVDVQHGPTDVLTRAPRRARVFHRFGVNVHQTWGEYHLLSYADLWSWYGRDRVRPLPLDGYFGFSALDRPGVPRLAARLARAWVAWLPEALRATPLNPYVLAEVRP